MCAKMTPQAANEGKPRAHLQAQKLSSRVAWQPGPSGHPAWLTVPWRADRARMVSGNSRPWKRLEWPAKAEAPGTAGEAPPKPHFVMVQDQQRHVLDIIILGVGGGGSHYTLV